MHSRCGCTRTRTRRRRERRARPSQSLPQPHGDAQVANENFRSLQRVYSILGDVEKRCGSSCLFLHVLEAQEGVR